MVAHVGVISLGSCFPSLPRLPRLYSTKHKPFASTYRHHWKIMFSFKDSKLVLSLICAVIVLLYEFSWRCHHLFSVNICIIILHIYFFSGTYVLFALAQLIGISYFLVAVMSEDPVREWILSEGKATQITKISPVGGGCINLANRYETDAGSFFVKTNR